jgi:hypothetical protein
MKPSYRFEPVYLQAELSPGLPLMQSKDNTEGHGGCLYMRDLPHLLEHNFLSNSCQSHIDYFQLETADISSKSAGILQKFSRWFFGQILIHINHPLPNLPGHFKNEKGSITCKKFFLVTIQQIEPVCSIEICVKIKLFGKFHIRTEEFKISRP